MTVSNFAPLAVAVAAVVLVVLARVHEGVDRVLTRTAIGVFGGYVEEFRSEHPDRQAALRKAHFATTYREYGSKTLLYAAIAAVVGSVAGMYVIWGLLTVLAIDPDVLRESLPGALAFLADVGGVPALTVLELFALITVSSLTIGFVSGGATAWLRWWYPSYVADNRARRIEAALPATIAFVYALSKSGMEFPTVVRIVAENEDTYGAAAEEFQIAVRNVDTFGMDVISAVQAMGQRTASPQLRELSENLASVLQSGQSLSEFLEREYHDYQEEAESQQEGMLELLATLAEAYVTVLVAGPLFLITILVVIGFAVSDTLEPLRVLIYVILPFANVAFIVYLGMVTDVINPGRADAAVSGETRRGDVADVRLTDGGRVASDSPNVERLRIYRRFEAIRNRVGRPVETVLERPTAILAVTVPVTVLAIFWQVYRAYATGTLTMEAVDVPIAVGAIFLTGTFAVVYEIHRRRIDAIEAAIPDLLDRLASLNQAGMPIITAIDHVRDSDLGELTDEFDRVWADVEWGSDLETALYRFASRVRTRAVSRVVTLLTESMNASGNLGTVLNIAAGQASSARRLKRERKQAMLEYMVVVYVAFFVFLFIIAVLSAYLLPNLPTEGVDANAGAAAVGGGGGIDGLGTMEEFDIDAYTTLFFHATFIQGALSGFIAGQLSTGDVKAGAKHATLMMVAALLISVFVF